MTTISEEYRALNRRLHETDKSYGMSGATNSPDVINLYQKTGGQSMLDYGSGKGSLATMLRINGLNCAEYDPAVPGKDAPPEPADFVFCGDVAEHVEPEYIDAFLDDLKRVTRKNILLIVGTRPAQKILEDGRNAHISLHPVEWWLPKLRERFELKELSAVANAFRFWGKAL